MMSKKQGIFLLSGEQSAEFFRRFIRYGDGLLIARICL
jgi:hypothetical protein